MGNLPGDWLLCFLSERWCCSCHPLSTGDTRVEGDPGSWWKAFLIELLETGLGKRGTVGWCGMKQSRLPRLHAGLRLSVKSGNGHCGM